MGKQKHWHLNYEVFTHVTGFKVSSQNKNVKKYKNINRDLRNTKHKQVKKKKNSNHFEAK